MSGKVGRGRSYRSPSRIRWLKWQVGKARAEGREPASSVLEELGRAEEVAQRMRRRAVRNRRENQPGRRDERSNKHKDREPSESITTRDFGLELVTEFNGASLSAAIAHIEANMRGGRNLATAIAACHKNEWRRLQLAVWLFSKVLPELRVGLSQVSTVKILKLVNGGGLRVNIVKQSGKTEGRVFAGP